MISYEEAYAKAKALKPDMDNCTEYDNAYVFGCYADNDYIGGGHSPVVILKQDGKAVDMPWYIAFVHGGKELRSFDL